MPQVGIISPLRGSGYYAGLIFYNHVIPSGLSRCMMSNSEGGVR